MVITADTWQTKAGCLIVYCLVVGWPGSLWGHCWTAMAHCFYWITGGISKLGLGHKVVVRHGGCVSFRITGACACGRPVWVVCESVLFCALHRPRRAACLWLGSFVSLPGLSNMNLFCFTLVRIVVLIVLCQGKKLGSSGSTV